jgi:hypothetical protein
MTQVPQAKAAVDPHERPILIIIICVIGFFAAALSVPAFFMVAMLSLPPWYPVLLGISTVIGLACLIGLWMMRKWAVYTYTGLSATNQVILIATGLWNPFTLLLPAIVIVVMFIYLSKMR